MKKILTTVIVLCAALGMQAALHLTTEKWVEDDQVSTEITESTTIIVNEYEWDEDLEEATMGVTGQLYSDESPNITVTITRQNTGILDQFCAGGSCIYGNEELTQICELTIGSMPMERQWTTHLTIAEASTTTIIYSFNDGVNPVITLTVKYCYLTSAVENIVAPQYNGKIYNLLGQEMPVSELNELPKGIYIINGKKYIKQ